MAGIRLLLLVALAALPSLVWSAELSDRDAGTYESLKADRTPSGVLFRLSRSGDKWVASGKLPGKEWETLSCDPGCGYRISTSKEIQTYFPPSFRQANELACIQNIAHVFCRFVPVNEPHSRGYVFVVLVTGKPTLLGARRLD